MKKVMVGLVVAMLGAVVPTQARAQGFAWMPLSVPEMAAHGATHMALFTHESFSETATNTATSFTNAVAAGIAVEFVKAVLDTAFDLGTANTNWLGSMVLRVGDGSTTDLFLSDTELASEGTEVWAKWPPLTGYAVTSVNGTFVTNKTETTASFATNLVLQTFVLTNVVDAVTNEYTVVTNATLEAATGLTGVTLQTGTGVASLTSAATGTEKGRKYYSASGHLVCTFTPNSQEALANNTAGQVRLFFRQTQTKR
jgi:hypothetical protein